MYLPRAGRSLDDERVQLDPVPLLAGADDGVRCAAAVIPPDRNGAKAITALRRLQMREMPDGPQPIEADCDLCGTSMPEDHRHLLELEERRIVCVCESCWALRSGEAQYCPPARGSSCSTTSTCPTSCGRGCASRSAWPSSFARTTASWRSTRAPPARPSPSSELEAWDELVGRNGVVGDIERDSEALVVDKLNDGIQAAIVPTDEAYRMVGLVKANWQGISGGQGVPAAVAGFFDELRARVA